MTENERALLQQALQKAQNHGENQYQVLAEVLADAMPQLVWATDADGSHFYYNRRWYEYTGLSVEDSLGFGFANALHPDDKERTLARWRRAWEAGEDYEIEYRFLRHDGQARWFVGRATPVRDAQNRVVMWAGTCTDIHEQKQAQAQLEAALQREAIQNKISDVLRTNVSADAVLAAACETVADVLSVSRAYYATVDFAHGNIAIRHDFCRGVPSLVGTYPLGAFGPPALQELEAGNVVVIHDAAVDPRTAPFYATIYEPIGIRAFVAVPIRRAGQWVSLFVVNMSGQPRIWTDEEQTLLQTVAGQTEAAAERARLYDREHRTAQAFQDTVSPPASPVLGAYRFASHYAAALEESAIGGDFYDQFVLPGGKICVVIGDVSGKGLAAAVQTSLAKFTLRAFATEDSSPARVLERLNRALVLQDALAGFVTLCLVVLDTQTQTLTYASAGHEPPICCDAAGNVHFLEATGPVIGVDADMVFDQVQTAFAPGDRLLLYTDGLTEARGQATPDNPRGLMGIERVAALLQNQPPTAMPETCLSNLLRETALFTQGGFRDDVAVLLVEAAH